MNSDRVGAVAACQRDSIHEDGVGATSRHCDAVDVAVRESTPREGELRQFRECRSSQVFVLLILIGFREEVQMTKLYNIKNNDMLYFLLFSVVLIPFQFIADVFTLSVRTRCGD